MKSLRQAINAKCADCITDPADIGTPAAQIACCTDTTCALHPVRPITCTTIPLRILEAWRITPAQLCERARPLVEDAPRISVEGQDGQLQDGTPATGSEVAA